jgi:hypothetical protein
MQSLFCLLLLLIPSKVNADQMLLDTVELKVHVVKYISTQDLSIKGSVFDENKRISIIPVDALHANLIPRFFSEPELSTFNGLLLDGTDDVLVWGYLLSEATGKKISFYYDLVKHSGIPTSFSGYNQIPSNDNITFSYASHLLDISFLKISLHKSLLSAKMVEKYKKAVPSSDGNSFYIYVPVKVRSQTPGE